MPVNDSAQHVVRTSAQWDERAIEFWVVPRGCLCVELTPDGKTKIKIGEGNKFYSQLPYITSEGDLANYYTKTEIDNLLTNLNRMAIQSTEEYDSKNDLPLTGNKLGDVRFVKSASPSIKTDPDVYVWNDTKWIYVGYDFSQIDLSEYVKKEEFEPVKEKVDEMYPLRHTHDNKEILDQVEVAFKVVDKNKLDSLENYDDTEVKNRLTNVENKAHVHNNLQILNATTAAFTIPDKNKLDSLRNYDVFRGTNGIIPGTIGLVPAPQPGDFSKVLGANGNWVDVDVAPFTGATATTDGEEGLVPAPLAGEQTYYLRGDGVWAKVKQDGDKYKAGDGIYILSDEVISDTFPLEIFAKSSRTSQYVIYGSADGVGEWDGTNYVLNITVEAEGATTLTTQILYNARLYTGDYVDYSRQIIHHAKEDMRQYITLYDDPTYGTSGTIQTQTGRISGNYNYNPGVTNYIEVTPGEIYWVKAFPDEYIYFDNSYHCIFDENYNVTRYFAAKGAGAMTIEIQPGEKYARFVGKPSSGMLNPGFLYRMTPYEEPCVLPSIVLYPNKINTIDVANTNKPSEIYIEAVTDEPDDPDDPMSKYTGIIYNEGVLDIAQEHPDSLNKLTVHFRETEKVLTLPEGDKYKSGDGIYILAGDASSTTLPVEIYAKANKLKQYVLYGGTDPVGDWDSTLSKYAVVIKVSAEGMSDISTSLFLDDPIGNGDYIDYANQQFVHTRTSITFDVVSGTWGRWIDVDGGILNWSQDSMAPSDYIAVSSEYVYLYYPGDMHGCDQFGIPCYAALYDENKVFTRSILLRSFTEVTIEPQPGEAYLRVSFGYYQGSWYRLTKIGEVVTPIILPPVIIYTNKVNTIDVMTTNKPTEVYFETAVAEDTSEDPMSEYTGIIYNDGVLDITQEDPNALNELTVHFRDDSKVLTLPDAEPMTGATASTDGTGGTVPAPLMGEEGMFLRGDGTWANVPGSGEAEQYGAGAGINIIKGEASGDKFPINIASNDNYLEEYIIYGTEAGVGDYDSTTHKYVIPVVVTAKDEDPIRSYIYLDDPLGQGEYVIYSDQKAVKYRENVLLSAGYESGQFLADTHRYTGDVDQYLQPIAFVTHKITMVYGDRYTLSGLTFDEHESSTRNFQHWHSFNDLSVVEFTPYSTSPISVPQPCGPVNRDDIEITVLGYEDNLYKARFYHHFNTATDVPTTLAQITIYAGKINTLDVETTNKPDQIYVRAHINTDPDAPPIPETWIIENTGILDVEQDETDRNKLTFKYKDTDKVITIPGGGGGGSYTPGQGIDITNDEISAKLGSGLSFDQNDAIQANQMTGADGTNAGTAGIVPAPNATDNTKFLKGDGTWDSPPSYTLPVATTSTLGGVKVGAGLSMNANDELGVTSPYVTSVANQGSVPGVITVAKSDGTSSNVDVLDNLRLILNCNYDSTATRSQLGEPVNAPQSGRAMGSPIIGDLTIIEVNE